MIENGVSFYKECKNRKIMVCLTQSDYEKIESDAAKHGLSHSSYCRQIITAYLRKAENKND